MIDAETKKKYIESVRNWPSQWPELFQSMPPKFEPTVKIENDLVTLSVNYELSIARKHDTPKNRETMKMALWQAICCNIKPEKEI